MVDWQGVTNFEESAENSFGRILLPRKAGGMTVQGGDTSLAAASLSRLGGTGILLFSKFLEQEDRLVQI